MTVDFGLLWSPILLKLSLKLTNHPTNHHWAIYYNALVRRDRVLLFILRYRTLLSSPDNDTSNLLQTKLLLSLHPPSCYGIHQNIYKLKQSNGGLHLAH